MPQIIVTATTDEWLSGPVMLMERINLSDFDSDHFIAHLVQRLRWAVSDSHAVEGQPNAHRSKPAGGHDTRRSIGVPSNTAGRKSLTSPPSGANLPW